MPPVHGRSIAATEIEDVVSREFTPQRFASLCNAISWAASGRRCPSLPSFTERVNAKDGGVDSEWQADLPVVDYQSPLLKSGWNVAQYKQRDVFAQGRAATFRGLAAGLKGAIRDVVARTGRQPSKYVLFTNVDLTHLTKGQKATLKEQILKGARRKIPVEIVGAAELAALLNSAPHLRSAFFAAAEFATWHTAWDNLMQTKLFGAGVRLIGRDEELVKIRSFVDSPEVRVIVISGAHNIGKSRLALQACEHLPYDTIVALDPRSLTSTHVLALASPVSDTLLIVEDPDLELAHTLVEQGLVNQHLKLLITLPTSDRAPLPSFGHDRRVQSMRVGPLSDAQAEELLRAAGARWDYSLESWVLSQAGGNPGILLFAASLGPELRKTAGTFTDEVGRAFEHKLAHTLGDAVVACLRLLSLLTHVGVSGRPAIELELVCTLFGDGRTPHAILDLLPRCVEAGVVRRGGPYVEVVPPMLASRLAASALLGRFPELCSLFAALDQAGRLRLVRRLRSLKAEETGAFWDALFAPGGLFQDLSAALRHGHLLRLIAGTVPDRAVALIHRGLATAPLETRRRIEGDTRRSLMWVLEELLFREGTSRTALECVAMLAEAENETYGNNATSVFSECFHPLHPQMPLQLLERTDVLRDMFDEHQPQAKKLLGVTAIDTALGHSPAVSLRRSEGPDPLGARPGLTYGQIWDYVEQLADLLTAAAHSTDATIARTAQDKLPKVLAAAALQARPEQGLERLTRFVDWATSPGSHFEIADICDAVEHVHEEFARRQGGAAGEPRARLETVVRGIEGLARRLEEADYATRFKRWIGKWSRGDHDEVVDEHGDKTYRGDKEIRRLAREAVEDPDRLTTDLFAWLSGGGPQKAHSFAWWLGKLDEHGYWRAQIEECGTTDTGASVFAPYFGGMTQNDRQFVSQRLDELVVAGRVTGNAIVSASGYLGGDAVTVDRVVRLLSSGRANPDVAARILSFGGWIVPLEQEEYLTLVRALAGPALEHAMSVVDLFGMWLYNRKPVEGALADFAWQCLEALPRGSSNEHYDSDQLAAHLAASDPARAFRLLERALRQPYDRENWNPLHHHGERKFWSVLLELDRSRALRVTLGLALEGELARFAITWDLREVVDQEQDAGVLVTFALEGQRQAELVADSVSVARAGFWPIAFRLIQAYPRNERIQGRLAGAAEHTGSIISGPLSAHYERCRKEVEARLADQHTPAVARSWLRRIEAGMRAQAEKELLSEIEDDVNEVRRIVDQADTPEREWAITALLRLNKVHHALAIADRRELLRCLMRSGIVKKQKASLRRTIDEISATAKKKLKRGT